MELNDADKTELIARYNELLTKTHQTSDEVLYEIQDKKTSPERRSYLADCYQLLHHNLTITSEALNKHFPATPEHTWPWNLY